MLGISKSSDLKLNKSEFELNRVLCARSEILHNLSNLSEVNAKFNFELSKIGKSVRRHLKSTIKTGQI